MKFESAYTGPLIQPDKLFLYHAGTSCRSAHLFVVFTYKVE